MSSVRFIIILFFLICLPVIVISQTVADVDGNVYPTVVMGKQVWMGENLRTTKYNDSKEIPLVKSDSEWKSLRKPAYCFLNNDISNKEVYGALYNWYTVNTKKLCPKGWHVPSLAEWDILVSFVGGEETAGFMLKEKGDDHWKNGLSEPNDDYGFTALPAGMRMYSGNFPVFANGYCVWWTSTGNTAQNLAWNRGLFFSSNRIYKGFESMRSGFAVRCVKD